MQVKMQTASSVTRALDHHSIFRFIRAMLTADRVAGWIGFRRVGLWRKVIKLLLIALTVAHTEWSLAVAWEQLLSQEQNRKLLEEVKALGHAGQV